MSSLGDALDECDALRTQLAKAETESRELVENLLAACGSRDARTAERDELRAQLAAANAATKHLAELIGSAVQLRDAANERVKALEAELGQALSDMKFIDKGLSNEVRNHASTHERAVKLEAALEPTAEVRREYVIELMANAEFDETADAVMAMDGLLHAIRARAGLTKEGK